MTPPVKEAELRLYRMYSNLVFFWDARTLRRRRRGS
jgi:hypothetical protein